MPHYCSLYISTERRISPELSPFQLLPGQCIHYLPCTRAANVTHKEEITGESYHPLVSDVSLDLCVVRLGHVFVLFVRVLCVTVLVNGKWLRLIKVNMVLNVHRNHKAY